MPRRLSRRYLEARLKAVAEALGWRIEPRWLIAAIEGQMKANPFVVYIAADLSEIQVRFFGQGGTPGFCTQHHCARIFLF